MWDMDFSLTSFTEILTDVWSISRHFLKEESSLSRPLQWLNNSQCIIIVHHKASVDRLHNASSKMHNSSNWIHFHNFTALHRLQYGFVVHLCSRNMYCVMEHTSFIEKNICFISAWNSAIFPTFFFLSGYKMIWRFNNPLICNIKMVV